LAISEPETLPLLGLLLMIGEPTGWSEEALIRTEEMAGLMLKLTPPLLLPVRADVSSDEGPDALVVLVLVEVLDANS